jgi:glycerophosphoryl diester phosphodiesterase
LSTLKVQMSAPEFAYFAAEHPIRFAHRGSRTLWPENTMYAFAKAVDDLGYRYVELDVQLTRDREVVVFHDPTLDRTTNGTGPVSAWGLEDLKLLDAGYRMESEGDHPFRNRDIQIPTLEEVYRTWPDLHLNIDLKAPGSEWPVAEVIRSLGAEDRTLIASFHDRRIARFRRITKGAVATSAGPRQIMAMLAASRFGRSFAAGIQAFQIPHDYRGLSIGPRLVEAVHRSGCQIHLWTVNDPGDMARYLDLGVDGIMSDRPDLLNDVVAERKANG